MLRVSSCTSTKSTTVNFPWSSPSMSSAMDAFSSLVSYIFKAGWGRSKLIKKGRS